MRDYRTSTMAPSRPEKIPLHILLFLATLVCTTWAGANWVGRGGPEEIGLMVADGLHFSIPLLTFLSVHEFAHFIAARRHNISTTLPYYIPIPPLPFLLSIGTMGAVIRIRQRIPDAISLFDTGASGPLAGFAVALGILVYGFLNLPPEGYIYTIHPEYLAFGGIPPSPPGTLRLGKNLLYLILETAIAPKGLPPMTEMYHYPLLFTGWLGCFVTALNLLPVGQLDGGHVVYAMFGRRGHGAAVRMFMTTIILLGLPSFTAVMLDLAAPGTGSAVPLSMLEWSWPGWMLWAFVLWRFVGLPHPPVTIVQPLGTGRRIAGWACIAVFILTFTPVPFSIT